MPPDTLPPPPPANNVRTRKRVQTIAIATSEQKVPVLDVVKRKLYQDWLRGVQPGALRVIYGDRVLGHLKVAEVDAVLREMARRDQELLNMRRAA